MERTHFIYCHSSRTWADLTALDDAVYMIVDHITSQVGGIFRAPKEIEHKSNVKELTASTLISLRDELRRREVKRTASYITQKPRPRRNAILSVYIKRLRLLLRQGVACEKAHE